MDESVLKFAMDEKRYSSIESIDQRLEEPSADSGFTRLFTGTKNLRSKKIGLLRHNKILKKDG